MPSLATYGLPKATAVDFVVAKCGSEATVHDWESSLWASEGGRSMALRKVGSVTVVIFSFQEDGSEATALQVDDESTPCYLIHWQQKNYPTRLEHWQFYEGSSMTSSLGETVSSY